MKEKIKAWLEGTKDFQQGIQLLLEHGKSSGLVRNIQARPLRYQNKLELELQKIFNSLSGEVSLKVVPAKERAVDPLKTLPDSVRFCIQEHSRLFLERSIAHDAMAALPSDNTPELIAERKTLSDLIADYSAKIDILFKAKEDFYVHKIIPVLTDLGIEENPSDTAPPKSEEFVLPSNVEELKKLKKNLQLTISKDRAMLTYQGTKKLDKPNPMPAGPSRLKLELRIKGNETKIQQIDYKLISLAN